MPGEAQRSPEADCDGPALHIVAMPRELIHEHRPRTASTNCSARVQLSQLCSGVLHAVPVGRQHDEMRRDGGVTDAELPRSAARQTVQSMRDAYSAATGRVW